MAFDDVDTTFIGRYPSGAAEMLRRVKEDVNIRRVMDKGGLYEVEDTQVLPFSLLEAVTTFPPDSILEKLAAVANQGLCL